ncbi:ABC transporter permease [Arcanobacterium hippocoleae]|uniref:Iron complex transport system permease protein n=1 Tax=Arcanobacterium hippocoleae TaxID=149017 RepID=A0ABU1T333_9ACTO|nr:iron chelate uptake ABC transporter family permease subunit [Arcanobacterium hippocoleae]MDR6939788.1 iron complex transport system permease protein [Arcanobacterium hippocoleae]
MPHPTATARYSRSILATGLGVLILFSLAIWSIFTGSSELTVLDLISGNANSDQLMVFFGSRIPRTAAAALAGSAMAVAGLLMQMLVQNRFVEPSTTGVTESAIFGVLIVTILAPGAEIFTKMLVAIIFALIGSMLLIALINATPKRDLIVVPLLGIVLSGIIGAGATLLAWEFSLQGTVAAWELGDFSGIISGRYELLWIVAGVAIVIYLYADRFTVIGLGKELATNLGVNHNRTTLLGLILVAITTGITTVIAGALPFLGLVIPNLVSLIMGDYLRRSLPLVAIGGACFVLLADTLGRTLIAPAEIAVGTVMGVIGALLFLVFLLRSFAHAH